MRQFWIGNIQANGEINNFTLDVTRQMQVVLEFIDGKVWKVQLLLMNQT